MLEQQITQCKHPRGGVYVIRSKFNNPKNIIQLLTNEALDMM